MAATVIAALRQRWSVGVVIPAQNEESTIEASLLSILHAARNVSRRADVWVVVAADRCADRTVERARAVLDGDGMVLEFDAGSPGVARRQGTAAVLNHFRHVPARSLWLANTDADTIVPADWLAVHLDHADRDFGAIAGIVDLWDPAAHAEAQAFFHADYAVAPDGSHSHVHGANLGFRADAYAVVGGWSDAKVAEDHCIWRRLRERGVRVSATSSSLVHTSGRLHGRASGGFADRLRTELAKHA